MSTLLKNIFSICALLAIVACSSNKDRFINRNFHAVTTEFNILYNGNLALEKGKEEIRAAYTDDYWEILPVERMQISEEVMLPGQSKNENFKIAEQKAAKAIQRHSMYIDGSEKNPQMDEAFLLLGKARYYDQRFIPALEAFNYILHKYPTSNNITYAKIWREKTNMRLDNNELAISNLKKILRDSTRLNDEDISGAAATLSQAYINLQELDSAVAPIKKAAFYSQDKEQKGRYLFIKGQLYNRLGKMDSANIAFDEVIAMNRKSPRIYMINAYLEKAKNFDFEKSDKDSLLVLLKELREDRENRPYLDVIHHQMGEYYKNLDSSAIAVKNYNSSLQTKSNNRYLHAKNYLTIGNIYFDNKEYKPASAYYDSTLTKLEKNTREFRKVKRKRDNLEDVVKYEEIASRNDSIIMLTNFSELEKLKFFEEFTKKLKEEDNVVEQEKTPEQPSNPLTINSRSSSFYFYNPGAVAKGKIEFQKTWGSIKLTDNWRLSPEDIIRKNSGNIVVAKDTSTVAGEKYNAASYVAAIPTDKAEIDSISKELNFANYQLGIIYKEKFLEYSLAAEKFRSVLDNSPEERLVLPSKYNLYKIYTELGNFSEAEIYKNDILSNHSDSRYAAILKNPESLLQEKNNPTEVYENLYKELEKENYQAIIDSSELYVAQFAGDEIVPKFEFLKAMAAGRYYGFEAYNEALNYLALTYPQSEEGKRAQQLLNTAIPALTYSKFGDEAEAADFKLIFPFSNNEKEQAQAFEETLRKALNEEGLSNLKVSLDIYNPNEIFVVVHNLKSSLGAQGLADNLKEKKKIDIDKLAYPISTSNYKIVQIHKNFDKYITTK